jgi:RND family efflux transporter MFP subunit
MKTQLTIIATMLLVGFLQACHSGNSEPKRKVPTNVIPVQITVLEKEKVNAVVNTSGQFTTNDETVLSFKTGGIIKSLEVKEGDYVKKGQILATLNLTEIDALVAQAQFSYEKSLRDFERLKNLYSDSVATLEQLENAKTALDLSSQQLSTARFNRSHSEIRAMENGYVLRKLASEGQYISAGTAVIETNGAGNNSWILKVGLSDREWSSIKVGDKATIETDAYVGQSLQAKVIRKSEAADAVSGAFVAELQVENTEKVALAAGLFGKAVIYSSGSSEMWGIPYEALLDGDGKTGFVFCTNDNKTAKKIAVEIASVSKDKVYISKGLENAENLITAGSPYLKENSSITVVK